MPAYSYAGRYLMQVAKGQRAEIGSDFLPDQQFAGWVKRISPVVDPRSGTFKVTVGVSDRFEALRPGIFVSVRIVIDTHEEAVLVPKNAIVYDGGEQCVFAVRDSVAQRVLLQPGCEYCRGRSFGQRFRWRSRHYGRPKWPEGRCTRAARRRRKTC